MFIVAEKSIGISTSGRGLSQAIPNLLNPGIVTPICCDYYALMDCGLLVFLAGIRSYGTIGPEYRSCRNSTFGFLRSQVFVVHLAMWKPQHLPHRTEFSCRTNPNLLSSGSCSRQNILPSPCTVPSPPLHYAIVRGLLVGAVLSSFVDAPTPLRGSQSAKPPAIGMRTHTYTSCRQY